MPQTWKQLLVEPGVSLLLVEELGEIFLRHRGLGGAAGQSTARRDNHISDVPNAPRAHHGPFPAILAQA